MSSWKECKLGDVAKLSKKTWKVGDELMPYIGLEHIEESKLRLNAIGSSENVASNKFRFQAGDTLFGKLRPYFRKVIKPSFDGICSTDIWVLNPQKGIDKDFLFYFFANQELVDISYSASSGTRMPRADWDFLSQTVWNIPPIEEQKAIAEVLSSLDDKIDLLHRQNQTLESLAQTLFRQWFIEEAKEEWENKPLKEICEIKNGFAFKSNDYRETGRKIIRTMNFKNGLIDSSDVVYIDIEEEFKYTKYILEKNDFLLVMVGASLGNYSIVTRDVLPALQNQNMWNFRTLGNISQHYLNFALREIVEENIGSASGSAREFFQKGQFYEFIITVPDKTQMNKFHKYVEDNYQKIENNRKQIQTLESLRDTLLPKLLSGEIKVEI